MLGQLRLDLGFGFIQAQAGPVQRFVGALDRHDGCAGKPAPFQPFGVDAMRHGGIARSQHKGRNILQQHRAHAGDDVRADFDELMHSGKPAQYRIVADRHMAGQLRAIGENDVIAHLAIVRHVNISHDPVVVADARHADILHRAGIESAVFADGIVVADLEPRRLAGIFLVLRDLAQGTELEDAVLLSDTRMPVDHHMRTDHCSDADLDVLTDDGIRADFDIAGELGAGMNDSGWVQHYDTVLMVHITSASAASWPSTSMVAPNLNRPRMLRMSDDLMIIWSPGPTGRLNRAPSMPAK